MVFYIFLQYVHNLSISKYTSICIIIVSLQQLPQDCLPERSPTAEVNVVIQDDMGTARTSSAGGFRGGTAANLRKALFAQHLGLDREQFDLKFDNLKKDGRRKSMQATSKNLK